MIANSKIQMIRSRLLDRLEDGIWQSGDKLPGARQLAGLVDSCFTHLQSVQESLVQQGILITVPRSGTFVRKDWEKRLLPGNLVIGQNCGICTEPLLEQFRSVVCPENPTLRVCTKFQRGIYEIHVSHFLLGTHQDYCDLNGVMHRLFEDDSIFFDKPLQPFFLQQELCGIPLIFSPRFLCCNRALFRQAGVPLPRPHWSWDDFLDCIDALCRKLPPEQVFCWKSQLIDFFVFAVRFGAKIIDPSSATPVMLAAPEMRRALHEYFELRHRLKNTPSPYPPERCAMWITCREETYPFYRDHVQENYAAVHLPLPAHGMDVNLQSAQLFCVRHECADPLGVENLIRSLLSEKVQSAFARMHYGVPIRRECVTGNLDFSDPIDRVVLDELDKLTCNYHLYSPDIYSLVNGAFKLLLQQPEAEAFALLDELAATLRFLLKVRNQSPN